MELAEQGRLYSFTYIESPEFGRHRIADAGYGVGQVDLADGVRVLTVLGGGRSEWKIGVTMRAELHLIGERNGEQVATYRFAALERADA